MVGLLAKLVALVFLMLAMGLAIAVLIVRKWRVPAKP
jgi:hypothetical protein